MSFTVEDGTGKSDANSYVTVEFFEEFHTDRGAVISGYDDAAIQAALIKATDYVDKRFGRRFRGSRSSSAQALEWPRQDAYDNDDIAFDDVPVPLTKAIVEYALLSLQLGRELAPLPAVDFGIVADPTTGTVTNETGGAVSGKSETVGPITSSLDFATFAATRPMISSGSQLTQKLPEYPQADLWLEELLKPSAERIVTRG